MDESKSKPGQRGESRNIEQPPPSAKGRSQAVDGPTGGDHSKDKKCNGLQGVEATCAVLLVIITGTYT